MIIKKDCGCRIQIEGRGGLSTITFKKQIHQCEKCKIKEEKFNKFFEEIANNGTNDKESHEQKK